MKYREPKIRPIQMSEILDFFDGNNVIKQTTAAPKKVNVSRYLLCVTKVVESRNWSVFHFDHNDTGIKYSNCLPVLIEINWHL